LIILGIGPEYVIIIARQEALNNFALSIIVFCSCTLSTTLTCQHPEANAAGSIFFKKKIVRSTALELECGWAARTPAGQANRTPARSSAAGSIVSWFVLFELSNFSGTTLPDSKDYSYCSDDSEINLTRTRGPNDQRPMKECDNLKYSILLCEYLLNMFIYQ
jgi:hypothetical protein